MPAAKRSTRSSSSAAAVSPPIQQPTIVVTNAAPIQQPSTSSSSASDNEEMLTRLKAEKDKKPIAFKCVAASALNKDSPLNKRIRQIKSSKQLLTFEQSLFASKPPCIAIDAPPSSRPLPCFSDISGHPTPYTDPKTKLRYANPEEFNIIRSIPTSIIKGYLELRKPQKIYH